MTAWDLLTSKSTAPANSIAWTHLNSINGNGLCTPFHIPVDTIEVTLKVDNLTMSVEEDNYALSFEEDKISINIDDELNTELNINNIEGSYNADTL